MAAGLVLCGLAGYGVVVLTRKAPVAPISAPGRQAVSASPVAPVSPAPKPSPALHPVAAPPPYQTKMSGKPLGFMNEAETQAPAEKVVAIPLDEEDPEETPGAAAPPVAPLPDETLPESSMPVADRPESDKASTGVMGIFNDPGAVLQAISWSADAARRMAVINGKICREGEQIGGYVILRINPEEVVVSQGSVTGRLVFKIR